MYGYDKEIILKLKNVSIDIESVISLKEISFSVSKGENIVIFGPENSGLDIIFPLILGFEGQYEGEIIYKNGLIRDFDYFGNHNFRKDVGYLHSDYGLISNMTVYENISLPLDYHSKMSVKKIKEFVNELITELNLDYCRGLRPVDLTNSEILRTAFARAIALDPELLFIEHAMEGQSPLNLQTFLVSLKKRALKKDKSVIFVTFEPENFIDLADSFVMMFNGRIVFHGSKEELLEGNNEYVKQYMGMSNIGPMVIL